MEIHNWRAWIRSPCPSYVKFLLPSYLLDSLKWLESMQKQSNPQFVLVCLQGLPTFNKNYISTSTTRNVCGAGGGRLGDNRGSPTCTCCAHLLFPSGLVTPLDVGYWAGQALHLTLYSCSHVCKLWDFKPFKNPEKKWLLAQVPCGFCFHLQKKPDKIQDVCKK